MAASSQHPLPFPLALIASALLVLAALILFGLAIMHWRHARRLVADGPHRVVIGWRLVATAYTLWGLAVSGLAGLSLVYPFDGRQLILPPRDHVGLALEVTAYAIALLAAAVLALGFGLGRLSYR